jgi:hypothetical protein
METNSPQVPPQQGGTPPPNPFAPPPAPAPAPAPAAAAAQPQTVAVPLDQLQSLLSLQAQVAEMQARERQREQEAQDKVTQALLQKGQAEEAVNTVRTQLTGQLEAERNNVRAMEARTKVFARDRELAAATVGLPFASEHAAKGFLKEVAPLLDAYPDGDGFVVRTATFQTPAQLVAAARQDPQYAHFFAASTQGGVNPAGGQGQPPTPAGAGGPQPEPRNLGEAVIARWREQGARRPLPGLPPGVGYNTPPPAQR